MSTMTYKAQGRYQFGWNDPRARNFTTCFEEIQGMAYPHFASDMTCEQLKAAWLLMFGDRPVNFEEVKRKWDADPSGDDMRVSQEVHLRGLLASQHDFASYTNIYVLKDKLNASN